MSIPDPRDNDADDVTLALEVAKTQLASGDRVAALKWLRKAADAAFEADDDERGMQLSKAAAELSATKDKPQLPVPKGLSSPPPAQKAPQTSQRPAAKPSQRPAAKQSQRPSAKPSQRPAKPSERPPPKRGPSSKRRPSVKAPPPDEEKTREHTMEDLVGATVADEWPTESLDEFEVVDEKRPRSSVKPRAAIAVAQAVRVAVGNDAKGSVTVRLLDSKGLQPGEVDAMLVALTPEVDLTVLF